MNRPLRDADIPERLRGDCVLLVQPTDNGYAKAVYAFSDSPDSIRTLREQCFIGPPETEIKISGLKGDVAVQLAMYIQARTASLQRITRAELMKVLEGMKN